MNTHAIYHGILKGGDKQNGLQVQKEKEVLAEREMLESAKWKEFSSSEIGRELLFDLKVRVDQRDWELDAMLKRGAVDKDTALLKAMETKTLRDVMFRIKTGKFEN